MGLVTFTGEMRNTCRISVTMHEEGISAGDLSVEGGMVLRWILKIKGMEWTSLARYRFSGGLFEYVMRFRFL
jgi:hypothetical protein